MPSQVHSNLRRSPARSNIVQRTNRVTRPRPPNRRNPNPYRIHEPFQCTRYRRGRTCHQTPRGNFSRAFKLASATKPVASALCRAGRSRILRISDRAEHACRHPGTNPDRTPGQWHGHPRRVRPVGFGRPRSFSGHHVDVEIRVRGTSPCRAPGDNPHAGGRRGFGHGPDRPRVGPTLALWLAGLYPRQEKRLQHQATPLPNP